MYYVIDSTLKNDKNQSAVFVFKTVQEVIKQLESAVKRKFGKTRKEYMFDMESLGIGYDDGEGRNFVESLSQYFDVGVLRGDKPIRTNIFDAARFLKEKDVHGD